MIFALIIANILMISSFVLRFSTLPPEIPLLYSKQWGEDQLIDVWFIFLLPILLNLLFFINNFLYRKFFLNNLLIKKIIHYLNLFFIIVITSIFIRIIFLVT